MWVLAQYFHMTQLVLLIVPHCYLLRYLYELMGDLERGRDIFTLNHKTMLLINQRQECKAEFNGGP